MNEEFKDIVQYFSGITTFGRKCTSEVTRDGSGLSSICLKIILPELPNGLNYKPFIIYDILKTFSLEIGGSTIFEFNSKQLEMIDKRIRVQDQFYKLCSVTDRTVIYPINLGMFFGESKLLNKEIEFLDYDYCGIRLGNYEFFQTKFYCRFGNILDIIESNLPLTLEIKEQLSTLEFEDAFFISDYRRYLTNNNEAKHLRYEIDQKFHSWLGDELALNCSDYQYYYRLNFKISSNIDRITEILFELDNDIDLVAKPQVESKLKYYQLFLNNKCICDIEATNNTMLSYQCDNPNIGTKNKLYGCHVDIQNINQNDNLNLVLCFNEFVNEKININYLFKIGTIFFYKDGMCGISRGEPRITFVGFGRME